MESTKKNLGANLGALHGGEDLARKTRTGNERVAAGTETPHERSLRSGRKSK
jgi:hypothetical protein